MTKQQINLEFVVANRITDMFFPKINRLFLGTKSRITTDQKLVWIHECYLRKDTVLKKYIIKHSNPKDIKAGG